MACISQSTARLRAKRYAQRNRGRLRQACAPVGGRLLWHLYPACTHACLQSTLEEEGWGGSDTEEGQEGSEGWEASDYDSDSEDSDYDSDAEGLEVRKKGQQPLGLVLCFANSNLQQKTCTCVRRPHTQANTSSAASKPLWRADEEVRGTRVHAQRHTYTRARHTRVLDTP